MSGQSRVTDRWPLLAPLVRALMRPGVSPERAHQVASKVEAEALQEITDSGATPKDWSGEHLAMTEDQARAIFDQNQKASKGQKITD